jgi:hypothetical protein
MTLKCGCITNQRFSCSDVLCNATQGNREEQKQKPLLLISESPNNCLCRCTRIAPSCTVTTPPLCVPLPPPHDWRNTKVHTAYPVSDHVLHSSIRGIPPFFVGWRCAGEKRSGSSRLWRPVWWRPHTYLDRWRWRPMQLDLLDVNLQWSPSSLTP